MAIKVKAEPTKTKKLRTKKLTHVNLVGVTLLFDNREPHVHMFETAKPLSVGDTFHLDWTLEVMK